MTLTFLITVLAMTSIFNIVVMWISVKQNDWHKQRIEELEMTLEERGIHR